MANEVALHSVLYFPLKPGTEPVQQSKSQDEAQTPVAKLQMSVSYF